MDILYQLPFPQEVCSKIFIYACKSPHTGLAIEVLKNKLNLNDVTITLPEKDEDVTCIDKDKIFKYTYLDESDLYDDDDSTIDIYFYT